MKYKAIILLIIGTFLFSNQVVAKANEQTTIEKLNALADEALQLTKFSRFDEAKNRLETFAELFSEKGIVSQSFTMDELRVVTAAHHEALKSVTSVDLDPRDRIKQVTAFRLAIDAVTSEYQPLWTEMEETILTTFQEVKSAAQEGNSELYNRELNEFLSTYAIIQPSLKIDLSVDKVQKLDSKISYIDRYRSIFSDQKWLTELDLLENDLKKLFTDLNKDDTDPSIWWVIIMTGGIIVSTLSYVSWRKYKGHKQERKRKNQNN